MTTEIRNDEVGIFLARELETILARTFEVEYADIKYSSLIPISSEVGNGADSYTYRVFDKQGSMKVIGDKAQDLPRADVLRKEVTHPIRSLGASFAYTIQETRAAAMVPGMNLEQRRANAVRRAYEEKVQEIAYFGDAPSGMKGFFNNDQVDKLVPDKWFDTAGVTTDEMLALLNEAPTRLVQNSNMKEMPNTMLVPYNVYRIISTTPRSTTSDTTVMEFFLRTNPMITAIEPINELEASKSGGALSKDRVICYDRSPDKL
ncbi:MAG: major capsid family protein, partial [Ilumatobacteraceae bacterium]